MNQQSTRVALESAPHSAMDAPFFKGLAASDLRMVLQTATIRQIAAHSTIFHQQEPIHSLFLLTEGRARHFYVTREGQKILLRWIKPGEIFSVMALSLSRSTQLTGAETVRDSSIMAWNRNISRSLVAHYPILLENALAIMAGYLEWGLSGYVGLACHSGRLRLARALINLASDLDGETRNGIELEITNNELANTANVDYFTVSRLLRIWHRRGALVKSRGRVVLRFPEQLLIDKTRNRR